MSQEFISGTGGGFETDLRHFFLGLRKIWWQVLLLCLFSASVGFLIFCFTYIPAYTSYTTFVVSNKTTEISNEPESLTLSDISASSALANTFKYILLSDEAMHSIIKAYGLDLPIAGLKRRIIITPVSNTNILEMKVTTDDAVLSRDIANKIIEYYPDILERTIRSARLEVLNPPQIAQSADSDYKNLLYPLYGLLFALFITVIFVLLRLSLHDTVKTVTDISDRLGMNLLASIPKVRRSTRRAPGGLFITDKSNGFTFTESFKALRTKIEMIAKKRGCKTFVVSSALKNEGKTTAAINLSIALAGNGRKVLLIDADLRKPSPRRFIGQSDSFPKFGIGQVLAGEADYESAVMYVKEYGVSVLLNKKELANSSELLSSSQMRRLIASVSEQYDYVIIDSPPAGVLTDSVVITAYADAVIMTVRQDYAPVRLVDSVAQSLSDNKAEFIGCIFNIVDEQGFDYGKYSYRLRTGYDRHEKYGRNDEEDRGSPDHEYPGVREQHPVRAVKAAIPANQSHRSGQRFTP